MKIGETGDEVKELQALLLANNIIVKVDGVFGPRTQEAVKVFQRKVGIHEDGIPGPVTYAKLRGHKVQDVTSKNITFDGEEDLDARTLKNINSLDPKARERFVAFTIEAKEIAKSLGYDYVALSGNRGEKEQNEIYAQGRTKPGKIITNARFGFSNHNFGIALDYGVFRDGKYIDEKSPSESETIHRAVSKIASKHGIEWGGDWKSIKDYPHFEIKTGLSLSEKRKLFALKGTIL